jgi:hypothetical protein
VVLYRIVSPENINKSLVEKSIAVIADVLFLIVLQVIFSGCLIVFV